MKSKRRLKNEGSIFQRTDGRWCGAISDGWRGGKRKRRWFYAATAEDVRKAMTDARSRIDKGEHLADDTNLSVETYGKRWLESIRPQLKPSTATGYEVLLRLHIFPTLGKKRLGQVTRSDVKNLLAENRKTRSKNSVRLVRATLSALYAEALDDGLVVANPAIALSRRRGNKRADSISAVERTEAIRPFSDNELARVLETARVHDPDCYAVFLTLARTGMRPGEAIALKWDDIDFERREVLIERASSGGLVGTTKTGTVRRVDLSQELANTLRTLKVHREKAKLKEGWAQMPDWIFLNGENNPLDISRLRKRLTAIMKRAEVSGHRLYDLRHTFATHLLANRAPITYVAAQLGHAKPTTTLQHYAFWMPQNSKAYVDSLDRPTELAESKAATA